MRVRRQRGWEALISEQCATVSLPSECIIKVQQLAWWLPEGTKGTRSKLEEEDGVTWGLTRPIMRMDLLQCRLEPCVRCSVEHLGRDFPSYSEGGKGKQINPQDLLVGVLKHMMRTFKSKSEWLKGCKATSLKVSI